MGIVVDERQGCTNLKFRRCSNAREEVEIMAAAYAVTKGSIVERVKVVEKRRVEVKLAKRDTCALRLKFHNTTLATAMLKTQGPSI